MGKGGRQRRTTSGRGAGGPVGTTRPGNEEIRTSATTPIIARNRVRAAAKAVPATTTPHTAINRFQLTLQPPRRGPSTPRIPIHAHRVLGEHKKKRVGRVGVLRASTGWGPQSNNPRDNDPPSNIIDMRSPLSIATENKSVRRARSARLQIRNSPIPGSRAWAPTSTATIPTSTRRIRCRVVAVSRIFSSGRGEGAEMSRRHI